MKRLLVVHHLGLGDIIVCNAIYRKLAAENELLCLPVKYHNVPSVAFMLRDLENVCFRPVEDDEEMLMFRDRVWNGEVLGLGLYAHPFDGRIWDQEFYRHAGMSMQMRWDGWKCDRDRSKEMHSDWTIGTGKRLGWDITNLREEPWAFFHQDLRRGIKIDYNRIENIPALRVSPSPTEHIFQWWNVIELAPEIHCICSSFALFIDSIELPAKPKLFIHAYARPCEPLPLFQKDWTILP
jgi:hypothetical protein